MLTRTQAKIFTLVQHWLPVDRGESSRLSGQYQLPLLGRIAAGRPLEALAANEQIDLLDLLENKRGQERYALQVQGDSMINEGIWDGDLILCEPRATAHNGEIVVALIDEQEATLKRIQFNADATLTLWPANAALQPITYATDRVRVQGVFVGLLRLKRKLATTSTAEDFL